MKLEKSAFAMGCFWHPQEVFSKLKGILKTEVGFMGGDESFRFLSYERVCSGTTKHAEVVYIEFNPEIITYESLLKVFWKEHDSTQLNQQGPDIGDQYRSVIFYYTKKQKKVALKSRDEVQKKLKKQIVTLIEKAGKFYKAEEYHQNYFKKKKSLF